jgi:hypothetical protein
MDSTMQNASESLSNIWIDSRTYWESTMGMCGLIRKKKKSAHASRLSPDRTQGRGPEEDAG